MGQGVDLVAVAKADGRFDAEALRLVAAGLHRAAELTGKAEARDDGRHLTAGELVDGIVDLAAERWSALAGAVMAGWGLRRTRDLGTITFLLIEHQVFSKRDEDRIEDFELPGDLDARIRERVRARMARTLAVDGERA